LINNAGSLINKAGSVINIAGSVLNIFHHKSTEGVRNYSPHYVLNVFLYNSYGAKMSSRSPASKQ